jgi:hypothetical protein
MRSTVIARAACCDARVAVDRASGPETIAASYRRRIV